MARRGVMSSPYQRRETLPCDSPRVTAVVINLNGRELLPDALASLKRQSYGALDIVVVDNGSTDGSTQLVKASFPEVVLIENQKNEGFGGANNQGIAYALDQGADFVFLFNYDAVAEDACVSRLVEAAQRDGAGMIGPKILYYGTDGLIWSAGGMIDFWRGKVAHIGIREVDRGQYDRLVEVDFLTACAVLVSKELFADVGMFDPAFYPAYGEDTDLCFRAARRGFRLVFEPKATVWHHISASTGGGITALKVQLRLKHELLFFRRYAHWYHWATIPLFTGVRATGYLVRWILRGDWRLVAALWQGIVASLGARNGEDVAGERKDGSRHTTFTMR
jgi:GT2 family glycosyltransferase